MPIITVQVTREGSQPDADRVTPTEKAEIFKRMSEVLLDVLGKPLDRTFVIFEEVELEDWGWGGMPTAEFREIKAQEDRRAAAGGGQAGSN